MLQIIGKSTAAKKRVCTHLHKFLAWFFPLINVKNVPFEINENTFCNTLYRFEQIHAQLVFITQTMMTWEMHVI